MELLVLWSVGVQLYVSRQQGEAFSDSAVSVRIIPSAARKRERRSLWQGEHEIEQPHLPKWSPPPAFTARMVQFA